MQSFRFHRSPICPFRYPHSVSRIQEVSFLSHWKHVKSCSPLESMNLRSVLPPTVNFLRHWCPFLNVRKSCSISLSWVPSLFKIPMLNHSLICYPWCSKVNSGFNNSLLLFVTVFSSLTPLSFIAMNVPPAWVTCLHFLLYPLWAMNMTPLEWCPHLTASFSTVFDFSWIVLTSLPPLAVTLNPLGMSWPRCLLGQ